VPDVEAFPGHIACDAASRSEIVIPLFAQSARTHGAYLVGVLDLDSPKLNRFDEEDRRGLEALAAILTNSLAP
jgi:L-methionine (R)-S-oxide reductase